MSQNDFNLANQGFPSMRSDMNSAFQALASNSSGTSAPGTTYAYQFWYDETNDILKMRNADNDAWIELASFDQTTDEWEIRSAVIQAVDSAGVQIKTDDGTARLTVADDGTVTLANDLAVTGSVSGSNIPGAGSFSNRNKIINGNFDIWQRGTSGTSGYVADRWTTDLNGSTAATSRQAFTLGQTDVPNEPSYFHRTVVTSSAGASNFCNVNQRVESVRTFAGQTVTLSFWAKADANKDIAVDFAQYFGSTGSPSAPVSGIGVTTCSLTTSWQKFTITASIPSISGKTLGTANDDSLFVNLFFDAGSDYDSRLNSLGQQSGTFDIAQVQLEAGDVATPFEIRSIGTELGLCQRYYRTYGAFRNSIYSGFAGATMQALLPITPVMRTSPTITLGSASLATNASSITLTADSAASAFWQWTAGATGQTIWIIDNVQMDAEL